MTIWRNVVKIVLGIGLLVALFFNISLADFAAVISKASMTQCLLAAAILIPYCLIKAYRWHILLVGTGITVPMRPFFSVYIQGLFLGAATPARMGEFGKAWLIRDYSSSIKPAVVSVLLDRLCDVLVLAAIAGLGFLYFETFVMWQCWISLAAICAAFLLVLCWGPLRAALWCRVPVIVREKWNEIVNGIHAIGTMCMIKVVALSAISQLVWAGIGMLLLYSLGYEMGYVRLLWYMSLVSLLSGFALTFLGVGVREVSFAALFAYAGGTSATGTAFGLLVSALWFLLAIAGGVVYFFGGSTNKSV